MANRLQGKLALVTAAGQGIGRAIAEAFIAEGARVIATDLDDSKLAGLKSIKSRKLDVRSTAAVEALEKEVAAEFGPLDVLVNCAGFVHHGSVLECSEQDWDFSFDLNVKSMHRTIKTFLPGMLEKKKGAIVNISSAVSSIRGVPDRYAYGASKAAIIGLTKAVAADFIRQGIRSSSPARRRATSPGSPTWSTAGWRFSGSIVRGLKFARRTTYLCSIVLSVFYRPRKRSESTHDNGNRRRMYPLYLLGTIIESMSYPRVGLPVSARNAGPVLPPHVLGLFFTCNLNDLPDHP